MAPTADQRKTFGEKLRSLRTNTGMSTKDLAVAVTNRGFAVSAQAVGAWERGEYAPSGYAVVDAVELELERPGELAPLLGLAAPELVSERLDALELEVSEIRRLVEQILDRPPRRRGRAPDGGAS